MLIFLKETSRLSPTLATTETTPWPNLILKGEPCALNVTLRCQSLLPLALPVIHCDRKRDDCERLGVPRPGLVSGAALPAPVRVTQESKALLFNLNPGFKLS